MAAKLHKWHRRIGLLAAAFIIFLVITGIVLQHSDELGLPAKHLASSWLLKHYGIKPNPITTYQLGNQTVSHAGNQLYLSGKPVTENVGDLFGAIQHKQQYIVATNSSLIILDNHGTVIDEITMLDGLTEAPLGISFTKNSRVIIRGASKYWIANNDLYHWQEYHSIANRNLALGNAPLIY